MSVMKTKLSFQGPPGGGGPPGTPIMPSPAGKLCVYQMYMCM